MSLDFDATGLLEAALAGGGKMAELFCEDSVSLTIVMDDGQVEKVLGGRDRGAGLRLIHDLKTSYAHANDLNAEGLMPLARELSTRGGGQAGVLAPFRGVAAGLRPDIQVPPPERDTLRKVEMVRAAEAAARALDPRVRQVRVIYSERTQDVRIANSLGFDINDHRVYLIMAVHCVAEDKGLVQTGYESMGGLVGMELFDQQDPAEVAREAARRAVQALSADPAPGGSMPVVLSASAGGTMIHEAVGHGLEGDLVNENMSVYAGRMGQQVANKLITVLDDATVPAKRGSFGFDDEGEPSRKNVLIDQGVLTAFMQDRLSAWKLNMEPTGNGRRESYRHRPVPRMTNTMIAPGTDDAEAIIRETPSGLLVKKMGGGQVNTINGDFVFEVSEGYLIKDGKIGAPVRGATLTGNGPEVLMQIDRVGSDLGWGIGTCGKDGQGAPVADAQPTLRIPSMVVGGLHS